MKKREDKLRKELEEKFPLGSKFIYNSNSGEKIERIVGGFHISWEVDMKKGDWNNTLSKISIKDEKHGYCYEIEKCETIKK